MFVFKGNFTQWKVTVLPWQKSWNHFSTKTNTATNRTKTAVLQLKKRAVISIYYILNCKTHSGCDFPSHPFELEKKRNTAVAKQLLLLKLSDRVASIRNRNGKYINDTFVTDTFVLPLFNICRLTVLVRIEAVSALSEELCEISPSSQRTRSFLQLLSPQPAFGSQCLLGGDGTGYSENNHLWYTNENRNAVQLTE